MKIKQIAALGALLIAACSSAPAAREAVDTDTDAWWAITGDLSADAMEGRDTGSAGHAKAARYVADRWAKAGLKPAGDNGTWFQTLPLREVRVEKEGTAFKIVRARTETPLRFLHEISVRASGALPPGIDGGLSFRGYCSPAEMGANMRGKIAVCFGARRRGMTTGAERMKAAADVGALGLINVDDPGFTIEPARWPDAYARSISLRNAGPGSYPNLAVMRLNVKAFAAMIEGAGQSADAILEAGAASKSLPTFDIPARLQATFSLSRREFTSDNILGMLPGTDPALSPEVVVVSAHIDGYGYGEPVDGDNLYNGAFDDAAYVATLIRLAEQRQGKGFRRSVLFAAFTGEEKGLLGANWFVRQPTAPKSNLVANINLDQLRPLFPLKILTMHAIDDTSLGATAKEVAGGMGIRLQADPEPERNLVGRADHYPFLTAGVPATGFVFGYEPGTEDERRYREWYQVRYHRPQDDMTQPLDWEAARDINTFFYRLTEAVANADTKPVFLPGSKLKPS